MDTLLAAGFSAITLIAEHFIPWRLIFGKPLPRLLAYVLGVLAMCLPFTAVLVYRQLVSAAISMWVIVAVSGSTVVGCYALSDWLELRAVLKAQKKVEAAHGTPEQ